VNVNHFKRHWLRVIAVSVEENSKFDSAGKVNGVERKLDVIMTIYALPSGAWERDKPLQAALIKSHCREREENSKFDSAGKVSGVECKLDVIMTIYALPSGAWERDSVHYFTVVD